MKYLSISVSIYILFLYIISVQTQTPCQNCCLTGGTACSTAYNGGVGVCCGADSLNRLFCCPVNTFSRCGSRDQPGSCIDTRSSNSSSTIAGWIIALITIVSIGCCIAGCCLIAKNRRRPPVDNIVFPPQNYPPPYGQGSGSTVPPPYGQESGNNPPHPQYAPQYPQYAPQYPQQNRGYGAGSLLAAGGAGILGGMLLNSAMDGRDGGGIFDGRDGGGDGGYNGGDGGDGGGGFGADF